jgi:hypothetical protein
MNGRSWEDKFVTYFKKLTFNLDFGLVGCDPMLFGRT